MRFNACVCRELINVCLWSGGIVNVCECLCTCWFDECVWMNACVL